MTETGFQRYIVTFTVRLPRPVRIPVPVYAITERHAVYTAAKQAFGDISVDAKTGWWHLGTANLVAVPEETTAELVNLTEFRFLESLTTEEETA